MFTLVIRGLVRLIRRLLDMACGRGPMAVIGSILVSGMLFCIVSACAGMVFQICTGHARLTRECILLIPFPAFAFWILYRLGCPTYRPDEGLTEEEGFKLQGFWSWLRWLLALTALVAGVIGAWINTQRLAAQGSAVPPARSPTGSIQASGLGLHLESIYCSKDPAKSSAVINGQSLMIRDYVGEWSVKAISPKAVLLENRAGETTNLSAPNHAAPSRP